MSLAREDTFPQVKRFACDRCHSQKLRCPRSSNGSEANEPCVRCQKAGVRCNISVTQKTGRPSKASKLLKNKESTPGFGSPRAESRNDTSRPDSSFSKTKRSSDMESEQNIIADVSSDMKEESQHFSTSPPSNDTFMTLEGYCTPISRDEYSEFFDCNFDTVSPEAVTVGDLNESNYPTPSSISTSRQNLEFYPDQNFGSFFDNLAADENMLFPEGSTTLNNSTFTIFDSPITPADTGALSSIQHTPEGMIQCASSGRDVVMGVGDTTTNFSPHLSPRKRQLDSLEQPVTQISRIGKNDEITHSKTLSRLQVEIHDCSEKVIQQARRATNAKSPTDLDRHDLHEASGILLSTSERFIELTSCICGSITAPLTSSPHSTSEHQQSYLSIKPYDSSSTLTDVSRPSTARPLDSATFHLMLACHTRLLPAYDAILDSISQRLPNPNAMGTSGDVFSIGSFTVPNGTFLESLLHLQVISHQLHRLSTTLHSHLLASRPHRPAEETGSAHMRWGLCKARRMAPVSMGDFAMEEVEEREAALQAKIAKISELARKSRML